MNTHRMQHVGMLTVLAILATAFFAFPALVSAQEQGTSTDGTVFLEVSKVISSAQFPDPGDLHEEDFSFTITGPGVNVTIPHQGVVELPVGEFSITESYDGNHPLGFVPEDWTVYWVGDLCEGPTDVPATAAGTIVVEESDIGKYVEANPGRCNAENQYKPDIEGCTDPQALNYDPAATVDDGSCRFEEEIEGCTDPDAINFDPDATIDDGSCEFEEEPQCELGVELLANGDFESPEVTDGAGWDIFDLSTFPVLGWMVDFAGSFAGAPDEASLELHSSVNSWSHASGEQHAELDADWQGPAGTSGEEASVIISQDVPTVPGETYTLSWEFSPRPGTPEADNILEVLVDGAVRVTQQASGSGLSDTSWESGSIEFDADDEDVTVAFRDAGAPNSEGTFLDNVSLICGTTTDNGDDDEEDGEAFIIVDKVTSPGGSQQAFQFAASWEDENFDLADGSAPHNSGDLTDMLEDGPFSVEEVNIPQGWTLSSVVCESSLGDEETADSIDLNEGETVTCTFTNTQPTITTDGGGGRSGGGGGGTRPPVCELFEADTDGGTMTLRWETRYGGDLNITKDGEEIFSTTINDEVDEGSFETDDDDAEFELRVWRGTRSDTCTLGDSDGGSGGSGGDEPEGQVLGEQVSLVPYGAADAGAGGAAAATLPQGIALLMAIASIFGLRPTRD